MLTKKMATSLLVAWAMLLASHMAWADDSSSLSLETGFHYNTGTYGTAIPTRIEFIPLTINYETLPWTLKLTIPYIRISGADNVIVGLGAQPNTKPAIRTASGLGDVTAAATYNIYNSGAYRLGVDLTAKIKFGTANRDTGLGTGKNDYGIQMDVYKNYDPWTLFGSVGYTVTGSSELIPLNNAFNARVGGVYTLSNANSAGLTFDSREKESPTNPVQRELIAFFSHNINKTWKMQSYLLKGFSIGSPDWGGGISVTNTY